MSNRHDNYFKQVFKENDLDAELAELEQADWDTIANLGIVGLVSGGAVTPSGSLAQATVAPFNGFGQTGQRLVLGASQVVSLTDDSDGNPIVPSSGNFKWVSLIARYAKFGSSPVTDGDGETVYFVQTEGISSKNTNPTVDTDTAQFGQIHVIQGTQAATISAANRPAVTSPDILIADLLIDDTGKVHGGIAGVSTARSNRVARRLSGAPKTTNDFDSVFYALVDEFTLDDSVVVARLYVSRANPTSPTFPAFAFAINAKWDGAAQLWRGDITGPATLVEFGIFGWKFLKQTRNAITWTDAHFDPGGWDSEISLGSASTNQQTTIDATGQIVGTGPQTAFAAVETVTAVSDQAESASFTWPQAMAATPSSLTLTDTTGGVFDVNVATVSAIPFNPFGGLLTVNSSGTIGQPFRASRKIVAVV
jgi:hypothetical protein